MGQGDSIEWVLSGKVHFPLGEGRGRLIRHFTLLMLIRKFQAEWFKIALLGEDKTSLRLGTKSWCGLAKATPFWSFLFNTNKGTVTLKCSLSHAALLPVATQKDGSSPWLYSRFRVRQIRGRTYLDLAKELVLPSCQPALI